MDVKDIERIRKSAIKNAVACGFSLEAEDIAQQVLLDFTESGRTGKTVRQAVIDVIRRTTGRKGTGQYDARHNLNKAAVFDAERHERLIQPQYTLEFQDLLKSITGVERAVICLKFQWGFTSREIAECFGVTEERICQRLSAILPKLNKKI
jgi:RNA polymerase sigma factor (sigma-70 family)